MCHRLIKAENSIDIVNPRVLVISRRESLIGTMLERLIPIEKDWMVLQVSEDQKVVDLIQKVNEKNPNIVVVPQDEYISDEQLFLRFLQDCSEIKKVITVSLQENKIEVYCKQKVQIKSSQDLLSEVNKQLFNFCPEAVENHNEKISSIDLV